MSTVYSLDVAVPLTVVGVTYKVAAHPVNANYPYGQEGRAAVVYQLHDEDGKPWALKVFKQAHRTPSLVRIAERIAPFASFPGLQVCQRTVLTATQHRELLKQFPDLTYAVLMPWINGPTWVEIVTHRRQLSATDCLRLAQSLAVVLTTMEENGIAHCDLSGANLLLPALAGETSSEAVALVDVEQLYSPDLVRPEILTSGSAGYGFLDGEPIWGSVADRFAGAILLSEILSWCDGRIRQAAWGDSYYGPGELKQSGDRAGLMAGILRERWGTATACLFEQAWHAESVTECATFGEWLSVLPAAELRVVPGSRPSEELAESGQADSGPSGTQQHLDRARDLEAHRDLGGALVSYRRAVALVPNGDALGQELSQIVASLESVQGLEGPAEPKAGQHEPDYTPSRSVAPITGSSSASPPLSSQGAASAIGTQPSHLQQKTPSAKSVPTTEYTSQRQNKRTWRALGVWGSLALLLGFSCLLWGLSVIAKRPATTASPPTVSGAAETGVDAEGLTEITLSATDDWVRTRLVHNGVTLYVTTEGEWAWSGSSFVTADGIPDSEYADSNVLPSCAHGALIGRINERGELLCLGTDSTVEASGYLWLRINDTNLTDNRGSIQIRFADEPVGGDRGSPTSSPTPTQIATTTPNIEATAHAQGTATVRADRLATQQAQLATLRAPTPAPATPLPQATRQNLTASPAVPPTSAAVVPRFVKPENGMSYQNPIIFEWEGRLGSGQHFEVRGQSSRTGKQIVSPPLGENTWATDIAGEDYGEWRWWVVLLQGEQQISYSEACLIWFTPLGTGGGSSCPLAGQGDLNCDGEINVDDLQICYSEMRCDPAVQECTLRCDLDGNGTVDVHDFAIWYKNYRGN